MSDAFRRAMRDLGASAPEPPDGLGPASRRRARGIVRRRVTLASLSGAAVLGVVAALLVPSGGSSRLVTADDPTPTVTTTTATPDVTEPATPSTSPSSTSPPPVHIGPPSPPAADSAPTVELSVVDAGTTIGRTTTLEAHIVDPGGGIAQWVASFGVVDPAHPRLEQRLFYGAGTTNQDGEVDTMMTYARCAEPSAAPTDTTVRVTRDFHVPGTYTAFFAVQTRSCAGLGTPPSHVGGKHSASATVTYTVGGPLWPNGPKQPVLHVYGTRTKWSGNEQVTGPGMQIEAWDDGSVEDITVDWGDGTVESVPARAHHVDIGSFQSCAQPDEWAPLPAAVEARPDHTYADPETPHTVTVTVTTRSCDGTNPQTVSGTGYEERQPQQ